jgi:uncharacterized protein (TIGR03545 family)
VVVRHFSVRGVRFDTERETSGALENPDPEAGRLWREIEAWADAIEIPPLSLEGLQGVIRTDALSTDSLATVRFARETVTRADSLRSDWEARLSSLDPRPRIDSVRAVAERLDSFRLTPVTALQVPALVRDGRSALSRVSSLQAELIDLQTAVEEGLATLSLSPETFRDLRARDLAYARGLLDLPTFDAPALSPALFGETALTWLRPVLYWVRTAERVLPPGLDPRRRPGPTRARADGTTFEFRRGARYPDFLLEEGDLDLVIGGDGAAAGRYSARVTDLTSSPTLTGRPMEIAVERTESAVGPRNLRLTAMLDHAGPVVRDSASLELIGVALPEIDLGEWGGRLRLGAGRVTFGLARSGERIDARFRWSSDVVSLLDASGAPPGASATLQPGSREWAERLIRRTVASVGSLELDMAVTGDLSSPSLTVSSNLGSALAASFRRELGEELAAAEARLRVEVDQRFQPLRREAESRVEALRSQVADRVAERRQEVERLRARLEARIRELTGG